MSGQSNKEFKRKPAKELAAIARSRRRKIENLLRRDLYFIKNKTMPEIADFYKSILLLDPQNADAHYHIAIMYSGLKDFHSAIDHYRKSLVLHVEQEGPDCWRKGSILMQIARNYSWLNCFPAALYYLNWAIEADPKSPANKIFLPAIFKAKDEYDSRN